MLGISSLFRIFPFVALVISVFLLGFLLIGGASTDTAYSSVFLVKAAYNETLPLLQSANFSVPALTIKANYLALCVSMADQITCSLSRNVSSLISATTVSSGPVTFSLVAIAQAMLEVCKPHLLVASIVLILLLLVFVIYTGFPFVPAKLIASKIASILTGLIVLVWGLGCMLQLQGVDGAREFIGVASMGMVVVRPGGRANAMAWTAFAFVLTAFTCLSAGVMREHYLNKPKEKF